MRIDETVPRRALRLVAAASLLAPAAVPLAASPAQAQPAAATPADASFRAFLPEYEAAVRAFLDGDVARWLGLLSAEPGGTLFTPFGEAVVGRPALEARYRLVAEGFAPGPARLEVEYLAIEAGAELAYVVALERSHFRPAGSDSLTTGHTRVTMIFQREGGAWRIRHRHMDHLGAPGSRVRPLEVGVGREAVDELPDARVVPHSP